MANHSSMFDPNSFVFFSQELLSEAKAYEKAALIQQNSTFKTKK